MRLVTKILEVWDGKTLSYFDELSCIKAKQMLISGDVTKLVGEDLRMANEVADRAVGMTEDPIINIRVLDVLRQRRNESSVDATAGKLV